MLLGVYTDCSAGWSGPTKRSVSSPVRSLGEECALGVIMDTNIRTRFNIIEVKKPNANAVDSHDIERMGWFPRAQSDISSARGGRCGT